MNEWKLRDVMIQASEVTLAFNQCVFSQGQSPDNYLIVEKGCIKVFARSHDGKEVVLYRVGEGEMCILTTACLIGKTNYPAEAVVEHETVARLIPARVFNSLLDSSAPFRQFVFEGLSKRLALVMKRIEQLVLESVRQRLIRFLLQQAGEDNQVNTTHEELAMEIGTAREVVSRQLKTLKTEGLIKVSRGKINIVAAEALAEHY